MLRETPGFILGVDQLPIHPDIEDALSAFDELGLDAVRLLDGRRQTGSVREVVSNHAVLDRDLHGSNLPSLGSKQGARQRPEKEAGEAGGADGTRTRDLRRDRPAF